MGGHLAAALVSPALAGAHGVVGRSDLPIPEWLFGWAAAAVLAVSFVALAVLWPDPKLQEDSWRPKLAGLGRALTSAPAQFVFGAVGVFLFFLTLYAALFGVETATANWAPTFVYVIFWVGLVAVSVVFGDVFRALNPWRAIGRAVAWIAARIAGGSLPDALPYPEKLGRWPAVVGLAGFAWLELVLSTGNDPRTLGIAIIVYSAATFVGMALYGVEAWTRHGEAFSVYFNLFSRISPGEVRGREIGFRRPLSGLPGLDVVPGTIAFIAVMIGSTTFDGAAESPLWADVAPELSDFFQTIGFSPERALELAFTLGLVLAILLVRGFYEMGIRGAKSVGGGFTSKELGRSFAHTLVPIAFAYVAAHYLTLLLYQGQAAWFLASDPLGKGSDLLGTADRAIDYGVIGATNSWYFQVGFVVLGHVAGLILAHDHALALYSKARLAVRSQYWMLAVMVGFTTLALWLLAQVNQ